MSMTDVSIEMQLRMIEMRWKISDMRETQNETMMMMKEKNKVDKSINQSINYSINE